jgi:hypothetical protein
VTVLWTRPSGCTPVCTAGSVQQSGLQLPEAPTQSWAAEGIKGSPAPRAHLGTAHSSDLMHNLHPAAPTAPSVTLRKEGPGNPNHNPGTQCPCPCRVIRQIRCPSFFPSGVNRHPVSTRVKTADSMHKAESEPRRGPCSTCTAVAGMIAGHC